MGNQKNVVVSKEATNEAINLYLKCHQAGEYPDLEQLLTWLLEERKWLYQEHEKFEDALYTIQRADLELDRQYKRFVVEHAARTNKEGIPGETS